MASNELLAVEVWMTLRYPASINTEADGGLIYTKRGPLQRVDIVS